MMEEWQWPSHFYATMIKPNIKELVRKNGDTVAGCHEICSRFFNGGYEIDTVEQFPIVLLSNFTIKGLAECIKAYGLLFDLNISFYEGEYGQWQQEIVGDGMYDKSPKAVFILLDLFGPEKGFNYVNHKNFALAEENCQMIFSNLEEMISLLKKKTKAKIIVSNFIRPFYNHSGILDQKMKFSVLQNISKMNLSLVERYKSDSQVWIFDVDGWLSHIGKKNSVYDKYYYLGDFHITPQLFPGLSRQLLPFLVGITGKTKKCLVFDLDDTIWGGTIGEDGLDNIELSPTGRGLPYYLLQKTILTLHERGVLLAINSKNNPKDALEVFRKHPYMILKEEHIASFKINWRDKPDNIREIAKDLNIGLDSLVFLDNSPAERMIMRGILSEVDVIEIPDDPSLFREILLEYPGFSTIELTEEDMKRGEMYRAERLRSEAVGEIEDFDQILGTLKIKLKISPVNSISIARASQLTQRTNQFNLTTKRYNKEDIEAMLSKGGLGWTLEVSDLFGEYGITGLILIERKSNKWYIDTMLLSCRILGKKIEQEFLGYVLKELKELHSIEVIGEHIPTEKNSQTENFYEIMAFKRQKTEKGKKIYSLQLDEYTFLPSPLITLNGQSSKIQ